MNDQFLLSTALTLLLPTGLIIIAAGASPPKRAIGVALMGLVSMAAAFVAYGLVGFGLQYGGLGLISGMAGAGELVREWSPLDTRMGPGWGLVGLDGFWVLGKEYGGELLAFFTFQAILAATAALIPSLALTGRVRRWVVVLTALLVGAVTYPLVGNWVWGGGWLANLGTNLQLGHGFVDFAGAGTIHLLAGLTALAGLLAFGVRHDEEARQQPATIPPAHFPLFMLLGALLTLVGWLGLVAGNWLSDPGTPEPLILLNLLLGASGGILLAALYSGFVSGQPDPLLVVRGLVGGLVAVSAGPAFVPLWAALAIGAVSGLLVCLVTYVVERMAWLDDATGSVATHATNGLWGLLTLGLLASGHYGVGWNGVGIAEYLGVAGQGVTGYFVTRGVQPDFPQQFYAQLVGAVVIILFVFGLSWLCFRSLRRVGNLMGQR
ncbi:MAG: ammonium transporter [Anaerolineae bacterium]